MCVFVHLFKYIYGNYQVRVDSSSSSYRSRYFEPLKFTSQNERKRKNIKNQLTDRIEMNLFLIFCVFFSFFIRRYICNEMSIKPESIAATDQSSLDLDLAWTKLLGNSTPTNGSQVVIKLDDGKVHESPNTTSETVGVGMKKSPSWLGSFNNQIRASIKAVTESPGPITR